MDFPARERAVGESSVPACIVLYCIVFSGDGEVR